MAPPTLPEPKNQKLRDVLLRDSHGEKLRTLLGAGFSAAEIFLDARSSLVVFGAAMTEKIHRGITAYLVDALGVTQCLYDYEALHISHQLLRSHLDDFFPHYHLSPAERIFVARLIGATGKLAEWGQIYEKLRLLHSEGFAVWRIVADMETCLCLLGDSPELLHFHPKDSEISRRWRFVAALFGMSSSPSNADILNSADTEPIRDLLLFPSSKRPRGTMEFVGLIRPIGPAEAEAEILAPDAEMPWASAEIYNDGAVLGGNFRLPVLRYETGMTGGYCRGGRLAPGEQPFFCGTFYYFEPESPVWLLCGSLFAAPTKLRAFYLLSGGDMDRTLAHFIAKPEEVAEALARGETYAQIADPARRTQGGRRFRILKEELDLARVVALGIDTEEYLDAMYGGEDSLDQPLCKLARRLGYEVVLLTRMAGENRLVTEVLDTRDRTASYASLRRGS
jgi:hypothetical protein